MARGVFECVPRKIFDDVRPLVNYRVQKFPLMEDLVREVGQKEQGAFGSSGVVVESLKKPVRAIVEYGFFCFEEEVLNEL